MSDVRTMTKNVAGVTWYWCDCCETWDPGQLWNGTGYTDVICTGCDSTFVSDFYDSKAWENRKREPDPDEEDPHA